VLKRWTVCDRNKRRGRKKGGIKKGGQTKNGHQGWPQKKAEAPARVSGGSTDKKRPEKKGGVSKKLIVKPAKENKNISQRPNAKKKTGNSEKKTQTNWKKKPARGKKPSHKDEKVTKKKPKPACQPKRG